MPRASREYERKKYDGAEDIGCTPKTVGCWNDRSKKIKLKESKNDMKIPIDFWVLSFWCGVPRVCVCVCERMNAVCPRSFIQFCRSAM